MNSHIHQAADDISFDELTVDDIVFIQDTHHNAHGARGRVYWLDPDTRLVSVVTRGLVDVWKGYADGVKKLRSMR